MDAIPHGNHDFLVLEGGFCQRDTKCGRNHQQASGSQYEVTFHRFYLAQWWLRSRSRPVHETSGVEIALDARGHREPAAELDVRPRRIARGSRVVYFRAADASSMC